MPGGPIMISLTLPTPDGPHTTRGFRLFFSESAVAVVEAAAVCEDAGLQEAGLALLWRAGHTKEDSRQVLGKGTGRLYGTV